MIARSLLYCSLSPNTCQLGKLQYGTYFGFLSRNRRGIRRRRYFFGFSSGAVKVKLESAVNFRY